MSKWRQNRLQAGHPDFDIVAKIEDRILLKKDINEIESEVPRLFRLAIDEVVDTKRTGRFSSEELEKTEKTYIGTKVEIVLRNYLGFSKGRLDLVIGGIDVDVKCTMRDNWMIPREAIGAPCLLVALNEKQLTCHFGIVIARQEYLNKGKNQDKKSSISSDAFRNIHWIFFDAKYPLSFWQLIGPKKRKQIMGRPTATERIYALFSNVVGIPIHREIVEEVAMQKDYMKRIRKNGGARDLLEDVGIQVFSGRYRKADLKEYDVPPISEDEFMSVDASYLRDRRASNDR